MSHRGSILCLPSGIYAWPPQKVEDIDTAACAPLLAEKAALSFVILGTGRQHVTPAAALREAFAATGIGLEAMDTGAACRTYNVLLAEGRLLGAGLIAVD